MPRYSRHAIALLSMVLMTTAPRGAGCQAPEAAAALGRLAAMASAPDLAARARVESEKLSRLDDVAWLAGELAAKATVPSQRGALLVERASALELLGRYGEASAVWEAAAVAAPGPADAGRLLAAAACALAAGDADSAAALAKAVGFAAPEPRTADIARLVSGWAALSRGDRAAAAGIADSILARPSTLEAAALMLAREAAEGEAAQAYESRLEAMGSRPESGSSAVAMLSLASRAIVSGTVVAAERADVTVAATPPAEATSGTEAARKALYQVGAFRDRANADALVTRLAGLGVTANASKKADTGLYVVVAEGGADPERTVLILKDAGYEAWAVGP